ncbi:MAG TPA: ATP phosphoribosyltransferase [Gammaproteobacteria bacterium]|nr:ATP phosphoribosyltransferase [Gammaproteobacteria bacterium]
MTIQAEQRIKVAVQKSGRLTDNSLHLMETCGLIYSRGRDQLICFGENMPVDVLLVRDDDIPELVAEGICDLGIVGMNVFREKVGDGMDVRTELELDFGRCRLSIAVPRGFGYEAAYSLEGLRIATSYPRILSAWLARQCVAATVVTLSGAVEIAPRLGRADVICDLVSTGSTLLANELEEVEIVFESRAALISRLDGPDAGWPERLVSRMRGVLSVRESKYIMLHAPRSALAEIRRLLPGSESPTVMPLEGRDDKVAVHAVCRENVFWETLESLKAAGASSMLVLPVEKMLA